MAVTLTLTGKTPGQTQFGLDTFTERYKCDATADVVLTDPDVPQMLAPHPDYPYMFITNRYCSETSESASALDLVYTGVFGGGPAEITLNDPGTGYASSDELLIGAVGRAFIIVDSVGGGGEIETFHVTSNSITASYTALPAITITGSGSGATFDVDGVSPLTLPAQKRSSSGQVASATTNTSSAIFPSTSTNPVTVQFYAATKTLTFISNDPADSAEPDDPPTITALISWDLGFGVQPGFSFPDLVTFLLTQAFVQEIIESPPDIEPLVPGHFYLITKRKTRSLFPYAPPS